MEEVSYYPDSFLLVHRDGNIGNLTTSENIELQPKLRAKLDSYLDYFIEDKLTSDDKFFWKFAKQKECALESMRELYNKFGNEFLLEIDLHTKPPEYLPMHIFLALEKQEYLNISDIIIVKEEVLGVRNMPIRDKFRIKLNSKALNEIKSLLPQAVPWEHESNLGIQPRLTVENDRGYLQINTRSPKLLIGSAKTKKFRLMASLFNPEGNIKAAYNPVPQSYDRIFEKIKDNRDNLNGRLKSLATRESEMHSIVETQVKELQKRKSAVSAYVTFEWIEDKFLLTKIHPKRDSKRQVEKGPKKDLKSLKK